MPPSNLTQTQMEQLQELWTGGLTSVGNKPMMTVAMRETGLSENVIKNWIGNERRRKGLTTARGPRELSVTQKYLPGQKRKKSTYSVFKSTFLSSEQAQKLNAEGLGPGEIQKEANLAYHKLSLDQKSDYQKIADDANAKGTDLIPRNQLVKRVVKNIQANMQKLDELGCPSIWIGYSGTVPERLFSAQMSDLAEDNTFTNFVVSTVVNKLSKAQMATVAEDGTSSNGKKRHKKKTSAKSGPKERTPSERATSASNSTISVPIYNPGDTVELLDTSGDCVCHGLVTDQSIVHGYTITEGWIPVMVTKMSSSTDVKPWPEFPTHSGKVEEKGFIAWRTTHLRSAPKPRVGREAELLKDNLHPDKAVSPGTIMSRGRLLRVKT